MAGQQISVHDLPRVREIARVLGSYGFGEIARLVGIETRATTEDVPRGKRIRLVEHVELVKLVELGEFREREVGCRRLGERHRGDRRARCA